MCVCMYVCMFVCVYIYIIYMGGGRQSGVNLADPIWQSGKLCNVAKSGSLADCPDLAIWQAKPLQLFANVSHQRDRMPDCNVKAMCCQIAKNEIMQDWKFQSSQSGNRAPD